VSVALLRFLGLVFVNGITDIWLRNQYSICSMSKINPDAAGNSVPVLKSCIPQAPLVQLGKGQAAELNYNLPQSSCFPANGYLTIAIPKDFWKEKMFQKPKVSFFSEAHGLTHAEIENAIAGAQIANARYPWTAGSLRQHRQYALGGLVGSVAKGGKDAIKGDTGSGKDDIKGNTGSGKDDIKNEVGTPLTSQEIGGMIVMGLQPMQQTNLYGDNIIVFQAEPVQPDPRLVICLHYRVCSYLGDYGAGGTVKTFSLLPGEKHEISIKTYKHIESIRHKAENVLDSFSQSSTDDLQKLVQEQIVDTHERENGVTGLSGSTQDKGTQWQVGGGVNLTIPLKVVDIGISTNASGGGSTHTTTTNNVTATFNDNVTQQTTHLNNALDHHVAQSTAVRNVSINTETTDTFKEGEDTSTTRTLENINHSRVLNFVFRQLLQAYNTVTYLDQVSFIYSNGYAETRQVVDLGGLLGLLRDLLKDETRVQQVREAIMAQLCNIADHEGAMHSFVEHITEDVTHCCGQGDYHRVRDYCRKRRGLQQTWNGITVPGIIVNVRQRVLRTDSVITEALLGQGEALDCYNQKLQEAATQKAELEVQRLALENAKLEQAIRIIDLIDDPKVKAELYKKVFGECCDVAQTQVNC
jgi:hypothetical protein